MNGLYPIKNNLYLTEPNHESLQSAIQLIRNSYDRAPAIYATEKFCRAITDPLEQDFPDEDWSGYVGRYRGVPVHCIPEYVSDETWAIVLPQYNFDLSEDEEENG